MFRIFERAVGDEIPSHYLPTARQGEALTSPYNSCNFGVRIALLIVYRAEQIQLADFEHEVCGE